VHTGGDGANAAGWLIRPRHLNPSLRRTSLLCPHLPYAGARVWDNSCRPPQGVRVVLARPSRTWTRRPGR
jgi:hypothetical protein